MMNQLSFTAVRAIDLAQKVGDAEPWIQREEHVCSCGERWHIIEPNNTGVGEVELLDSPDDWHIDQGHEVTVEPVMAPQQMVDLARLRDAGELASVAHDLLQEVVDELRAVKDSKQRVVVEPTTGNQLPVFKVADRKPRDTSTARYGWDVIARVLGVTTQAAQARFGH